MRRVLLVITMALLISCGAVVGLEQARSTPFWEETSIVFAVRDTGPLHLDAFVPATPGPHPAVVLVHGGGWRSGTRRGWGQSGRTLAATGIAAFSVDYRLSGEAVFPAARDDVLEAVRWVRDNAGRFGVDPGRIALFGGSAGANLSLVAGTGGQGPLDRGDRVAAVVAWSPPVDLTAPPTDLLDDLATAYLGCPPRVCPDRAADASAHTHLDPTDPPVLVVNSREELVPMSETREVVAGLRAAQVDHRVVVLDGDAHASDYRDVAWDDTLAFLKARLGLSG